MEEYSVLSADGAAGSLLLGRGEDRLAIEAISPRNIRVRYTRRDAFSQAKSFMVVERPDRGASISVSQARSQIAVSTGVITLSVETETGRFSWSDADGNLLVSEPVGGGKELEETPVIVPVYDEHSPSIQVVTPDGTRTVREPSSRRLDRMAYSTKLSLVFSEDEAIYGLGQYEDGILNYRGRSRQLAHANMQIAAPVFLSTRGYGFLVDSYSLACFNDNEDGTYFWTETDDEMEFYFICGPEFDVIVSEIRALTGDAPVLPRWAYGYVQSRERYKGADDLLAVAHEFRSRGIPLDCIVQDWQYWEEGFWGQKSFDGSRYPDPTSMIDELHGMNLRFMISIWPIMDGGCPDENEMRELGLLCADQHTYNAFSEKARANYWRQAYEGLFRHGVDAWWTDCTEPFGADWSGAVKLPLAERVRRNVDAFKQNLDPERINAYSLVHSQAMWEGQRARDNGKRVVMLTRSSYPGQQRYNSVAWSGDTAANWQTLRRQIAEGLNFTITGTPHWTFDIGAFFVRDDGKHWFWSGSYQRGTDDPAYRELYCRWFQLGAFLPMFRSHGTDFPREPWYFGDKGTPVYDSLIQFIRLRYRLLPYIYSLAGRQMLEGYTMLRNLAFDFREQPAVHDLGDQFMFGPAFLVAPITKPATEGIARREVYLPEIDGPWYDLWKGTAERGGQTVETHSPLDHVPLFVRAGSIVPMGPDVQHADEAPYGPVEIRIYPGANGSFRLYEDAGDGYAYEEGEYSTIDIRWDDGSSALTIGACSGRFHGMPTEREFVVTVVGMGAGGVEPLQNGLTVPHSGTEIKVEVPGAAG